MKVHAKQQKRVGTKKQDPKRPDATRKPGETPAIPATEEDVSAQSEQPVTNESTVANPEPKDWERQPRVNADEQHNIVNNPEHAQQDITDQRDK
jgi:hypothetical protein